MKLSQRVFSTACLLAAICIARPASAWDGEEHQGKALVLGDSVAFGYIATKVNLVGHFYTRPDNFFSFADDLGERLHLDVVNASCPGACMPTTRPRSSTLPPVTCAAIARCVW
jgi:hypothetical protein